MLAVKLVFNNQKTKILRSIRKFLLIFLIFFLIGNILYYLDINGYFKRWSVLPGPGGTITHLSIDQEGNILIDTGDNISYILNKKLLLQYYEEIYEDYSLKDEYLCREIEPIYVVKPPAIPFERASIRCQNKYSIFIIHVIRSNDNELWKWNTNIIKPFDLNYYISSILVLFIMQLSLFLLILLIGLIVLFVSHKIRPTRRCS